MVITMQSDHIKRKISTGPREKRRYFKTDNNFINSDLTSIDRGRQVIDGLFGKENHLEHHGILGQKWGIRRYQNADGSLTAEGRNRKAINTTKVATVLGGPLFGAAAGLGHLAVKKFKEKKNDTEKDENESQGNKTSFGSKERNDKDAFMEKRNSFKTDEEKDKWESEQELLRIFDKDKAISDIRKDETYGGIKIAMKNKLRVRVRDSNLDGDLEGEKNRIDGGIQAAKYISDETNRDKFKDEVVKQMVKDNRGESDKNEEGLKKNLKVYGMYIADSNGDTVDGEIHCEHRDMFDVDNAPYGDHSIDVEFSYDTKTKKLTVGQYSING